jgi:hypothetical protein
LATPLVDVHGAPAVGNIGQTGAPMTVQRPARRVQRVGRTATMPRPGTSAVAVQPDPLQQPDADVRVEMPARVPPSRTTRLEFQRDDSAKFSLTHERPLVNRRERPAHANMGRRAYIPERGE